MSACPYRYSFRQAHPSGQEHHRLVYAAPAQLRQEVDAQGLGKTPVEDDDIGIDGRIERAEQRGPIGKAMDGKSVLRQLITENVEVGLVGFYEKDANGVSVPTQAGAITGLAGDKLVAFICSRVGVM